MEVVTNDFPATLQWLESKLALKLTDPTCGFHVVQNGVTMGAVAFNHYTGKDVNINLAGRAALCRKALRVSAHVAFGQHALGCARLTALTGYGTSMYYLMRRLGFEYEGRMREYYSNGDHAIVWGMLKRECPWF